MPNRKAFTLVELVVVMVISSIVLLAVSYNFVAERRFRNAIQTDIDIVREAKIATSHISRALKFAPYTGPGIMTISGEGTVINAWVEGGHIDLCPTSILVRYFRREATNEFVFRTWPNGLLNPYVDQTVATGITNFLPAWDAANNLITLDFTFQNGTQTLSIQTDIRPIGMMPT